MSKDYMIRVGVSADLDEDQLQEKLEEALDKAGLLNVVYEVIEDTGEDWVLTWMVRE